MSVSSQFIAQIKSIPLAGIIGQGLTFSSLILPIFFRHLEAVSTQVFISAIITLIIYPATLSIAAQYPSEANDKKASGILLNSVFLLIVATLSGLVLTSVLTFSNLALFELAFSGCALLFTQGGDMIVSAILVRHNRPIEISFKRLVFGICLFIFTFIFMAFLPFPPSLIWASCISYTVSCLVSALRQKVIFSRLVSTHSNFSFRTLLDYVLGNFKLSFGYFLDSLVVQTPALAIPLIGMYANLWSVVIRLGGGFATIGLQLVNPWVESRFSKGFRENKKFLILKALSMSHLYGTLLSISGVATIAFGLFLAAQNSVIYSTVLQTILWSAIATWGVTLFLLPKSRLLALSGKQPLKWKWSIYRALLLLVVLPLVPTSQYLLVFSVHSVLFGLIFGRLTSRSLKKLQSPERPGSSKKVLEVIRSLNLGGAQKLLIYRLSTSAAKEVQTVLINTLPSEIQTLSDLRKAGVDVRDTRFNNAFVSSMELIKFVRQEEPDVVVVHSPWPGIAIKLARKSRLISAPVVEVVHATQYKRKIIEVIARLTNSFATYGLPVSTGVLRSRVSDGFKGKHVVHHGIPIQEMRQWAKSNKTERSVLRTKMSMGNDQAIRIIYCARLEAQKRPMDMIKLMAELDPNKFKLSIVGAGTLSAALRSEVERLNLSGSVQFLGSNDNGWKFISVADVLLLPSEFEGLSVTLMEAMAFGVPVIATNISGMADILQDGYNSLLFPVGDIAAAQEKFELIAQNDDLLKTLRKNCLASSSHWDSNVAAEHFYASVEAASRHNVGN